MLWFPFHTACSVSRESFIGVLWIIFWLFFLLSSYFQKAPNFPTFLSSPHLHMIGFYSFYFNSKILHPEMCYFKLGICNLFCNSLSATPTPRPSPFPYTRSHICPPGLHFELQDYLPCPVGQDPLPESWALSEALSDSPHGKKLKNVQAGMGV